MFKLDVEKGQSMCTRSRVRDASRCRLRRLKWRQSACVGQKSSVWQEAERLQSDFANIDYKVAHNLRKVQAAMKTHKLSSHHVTSGSLGYGAGDLGREELDNIFARIVEAESACVRAHFASGTHAIACGLFGVLRPGDTLLSAAGPPYDTLEEVIGIRQSATEKSSITPGSLVDWGVSYDVVNLDGGGRVDWAALSTALKFYKPKAVLVQRSCGYSFRPTLSIRDIGQIVEVVKKNSPKSMVLVDNCYGEFVEEIEPVSPSVGADLMMGSLIKNMGGSIAPCGGYIAGKAGLVEAAQSRLTVPGAGKDVGAHLCDTNRLFLQGLYLAPITVGEALKASTLIASVMSSEGYEVIPSKSETRDFITAVRLGSRDKLVAFCTAVQENSPVGAHVRPVPGKTPGYEDEVVFADGTFVAGSTCEMSADGPLREPFAVFCQGGNHWSQWAIALEAAIEKLQKLN